MDAADIAALLAKAEPRARATSLLRANQGPTGNSAAPAASAGRSLLRAAPKNKRAREAGDRDR